MKDFLKQGIQWLTSIGNSCPYTIVGKKMVQSARGKRDRNNQVKSDREKELTERVKTGRNVALIGVFCPLFWYSLFFGATMSEVYFNAAHSSIVAAIGLVVMVKGRRNLTKYQEGLLQRDNLHN